ncbi:MAG: DUF4156 domain-containing protein [Pseudomonadota bacterium]
MQRTTLTLMTSATLLAGCAAAPLNAPEAAAIMITANPPGDDCVFVGEVRGSQGNFWTAEFTKDEDLIIGARNELRNAAYELGANYVQLELENQSHNTADHSTGGVYSSVVIGNAYRCHGAFRVTDAEAE